MGSLWGPFSAPFSLRAILGPQKGGLLEASVLRSLFEKILVHIWIHFWSLWDTYDLDDMREGGKNHTIAYVGSFTVLDTILGSIWTPFWSPIWTPNPIVTHFGDPLCLF